MVFSLSTFVASSTVIGYTTKSGRTHYDAATASLTKGGVGLELTPNDGYTLLTILQPRSMNMGWIEPGAVLWIEDSNGESQNMLETYGLITLEDVAREE